MNFENANLIAGATTIASGNLSTGIAFPSDEHPWQSYRFDNCCKGNQSIAGFENFHIIKNEKGDICFAFIVVTQPCVQILKEGYECGRYREGIYHIVKSFPVDRLFDTYTK